MPGDQISVLCVGGAEGATRLADQLDDAGLSAATATGIDGALNALERVDCVVGACVLPDGDGLELLWRIREREPELPVVLVANGSSEGVASAVSAGVTDCLRAPDGDRLVETVVDAVERARKRQHAAEQNRRLQELAANTDDVLWSFTRDWEQLLFVNEAYEEIYGQPTQRLREEPQSFVETVHPDDREQVKEAMERISGGESVDIEYRVNEAEDYGRWVWVRGNPVYEDGEVVRVVGFTRDVTDRREYERKLERQNDRLDEFASVVSHDLRNPLNTLDASLQLAEETGDTEHFERGRRAINRMEQLIKDLLTLARQGDAVTETEPVALDRVVREAWDSIGPGGVLVAETDGTVLADAGRLRQLLENLLDNAVKHGSANRDSRPDRDAIERGSTGDRSGAGTGDREAGVTVTVGQTDDGFYVADDGPGIPPDRREEVFEAGYSTTDGGTGFGLRIVQQVAEVHGWTVSATESETGGARFDVTGVEFTEKAEGAGDSWYQG